MAYDNVQAISRHLGLTLDRELSGGSFGAFLAQTPSGARVVLKLLPRHPALRHERLIRAVECAEVMRRAGGPVPRYLDAGTHNDDIYTVQAFVPGEVPEVLTLSTARQLVEFWHLQRDAASALNGRLGDDATWASDVATALRSGTEEMFIDQAVLRRAADSRVRVLLDAAVDVGRTIRPGLIRTGDVLHGDFHHRNILVRDDRLVAVFDWESARVGDSRFDLAALYQILPPAAAEPAARDYLGEEVARAVPDEIRRLALAVGTLQRLTFAVRSRPDALEWAINVSRDLPLDPERRRSLTRREGVV